MKKILIALGFTLAAMSAQSATLSLSNLGSVTFTSATSSAPLASHDVITGATGGTFGLLSVDTDTTFRVTFLGKEAGDVNFYVANGVNVVNSANNVVSVGDSFQFDVSAGAINFGFNDTTTGVTASNIGDSINKIAYIANDGSYIDAATGNPYAFLIGFNDSGSLDGDYDDYVIGVSAVPVPAALPLLASALGAFGIARRRNKAKAAK